MSPFLDSAYSFPAHSLCHPDVCPGNPPSPFSRMQAHSGHFQPLTFFPPTKDLDPVFSLSAVHAIVSHSSATILMAHFHPRTNCMEKALGVQHTRKRKTSLLPPEDSELQHRKMTLARSISSYGSTHQTSVCNARTMNPFPSGSRSRQGRARLPSPCWSHSPRPAVPTHVALSISLAPAHLCVGNFSSHTYPYLSTYHTTPS